MNERKRHTAMFPIDREIGIQCQDGMPFMDFGHAYDASIRQRHRCVPIFLKQLAQGAYMLLDPECDIERTVLEELEQGVLRPSNNARADVSSP